VYKLFWGLFRQKKISLSIGIAAAAGTLTNTIGVLGMIYILYARRFVEAAGLEGATPLIAIFGIAVPNMPFELAAAVLVAIPVVMAVKKARKI
ncbi:MAG TPA: ECF transporter S component, partial [Clostridiaceae bacterium]|nr:ECF transporter S component [Clostridiaceae bacterium]